MWMAAGLVVLVGPGYGRRPGHGAVPWHIPIAPNPTMETSQAEPPKPPRDAPRARPGAHHSAPGPAPRATGTCTQAGPGPAPVPSLQLGNSAAAASRDCEPPPGPRPPTTSRINYNPGSPELPHQALTSEPAARVGRDHDHAHGRYRNCNTRACACPSTGRASGRKCVYVRVYAWTWACWIH